MPEIRENVYDPDKDHIRRRRRNVGNSGFIDADLSSGFIHFPTEDSAFKEDFSVLPVFVPTDTLDHLKECGKATKKSTPGEAVAEMSNNKGLRLLPFVHDLQVFMTNES